MRRCEKSSPGFTLVEILVVVAVTAVLIGMVFAVGTTGLEKARQAREMAAAKALSVAYMAAAADNNGEFLRGFDDEANAIDLPRSGAISAAAAHRYPYRLAPYFDDAFDGVILVNKNKGQIAKMGGNQTYYRSLFPALGMNATFVGGVYMTGEMELKNEDQNQDEVATRIGQVPKPSMMLVFASAGYGKGKNKVDGYNRLNPPAVKTDLWGGGTPTEDSSPDDFGQVDFRYDGHAVCAFLDGSVRRLDVKELRDMRYWSKNAQMADSPVYRVSVAGPPPGRGPGRR